MIIEKLKIDDIPELLNLYKELTDMEGSVEIAIETYKQMLKDEKYLLLVAKEEGRIIGSVLGVCCMILALDGGYFLAIEDVIVKEEARGKGVGRKLMEKLDEFAINSDCAYSLLVSSGHRKGAHKFYERIGFTEDVKGFRKWY
ncbi:GNAT family N-acetyltransferase [Clostridium mediterraneense]|uniref:GNAT family N-acetyltransferase n=1 Tax=Clostridium mediterraneense TaxID=1805472 RepID=UPI000836FFFD|nr:GNAT family N-acetyltransferase [Clostridium mediterraneense]